MVAPFAREINSYTNRWNWKALSTNSDLPLSLDLIERFADRWDWASLSKNETLTVPMLHESDVIEVMAHHLPTHSRTKAQVVKLRGGSMRVVIEDPENVISPPMLVPFGFVCLRLYWVSLFAALRLVPALRKRKSRNSHHQSSSKS